MKRSMSTRGFKNLASKLLPKMPTQTSETKKTHLNTLRINVALQATFEEIYMHKLEINKNNSIAQWHKVGYCCSKEFFEFHKDTNKKTMISKLVDGYQSLKSDNEIGEYIHRYFRYPYTNDQVVENNKDARH